MSRTQNPFSATPQLDIGRVPDDARRDVMNPIECGDCGTVYDSAREALDCNHDHQA